MDTEQKINVLSQEGRILQRSADVDGVVLAVCRSSSSDGPRSELPTGSVLENASVVDFKSSNVEILESSCDKVQDSACTSAEIPKNKEITEGEILVESASTSADTLKDKDPKESEGFTDKEPMIIDDDNEQVRKSIKRKKCQVFPDKSDDSDSDGTKPIRAKARKSSRIPIMKKKAKDSNLVNTDSQSSTNSLNKINPNTKLNTNLNKRLTNATTTNTRLKTIKVYTKATDESVKDKSRAIPEEDMEKKNKVGRPPKVVKAVKLIYAENEVLKVIGMDKDNFDNETLKAMTASDVNAIALEYTSHIDAIRLKCGGMQGVLSGEMKKRIKGVEDIVRTLQTKAETAGDPSLLKVKINQLLKEIKAYKAADEKRKRDMDDLIEIIKDLKKENKSIREEMKKIRESISFDKDKNKNTKYLSQRSSSEIRDSKKEDHSSRLGSHLMSCEDLTYPEDGIAWTQSSQEVPKKEMKTQEIIMVKRPPIKGVSAMIPMSTQSKEERQDIVDRQIAALTKRPAIRIIENRQLVPPRSEWTEVVKRNKKKTQNKDIVKEISNDRSKENNTSNKKDAYSKKGVLGKKDVSNRRDVSSKKDVSIKEKKAKVRRRVPKTAAISIKGKINEFSYADALKKVRTKISLDELEINAPRIRKGKDEATIIEILGEDNDTKADKLAVKIQEVLKEEAHISRPKIKGELKLIGLDESISNDEIIWMISLEGDCKEEDVRVDSLRVTNSGLRIAWVKCPVEAAIQISKKTKVKLGWTIVRAELLQTRPLQCFKCWKRGHVKDKCIANIDYSGNCYRCGKIGHQTKTCRNKPSCLLCTKLKFASNHRVGSSLCRGSMYKKRSKIESTSNTEEESALKTNLSSTVQCIYKFGSNEQDTYMDTENIEVRDSTDEVPEGRSEDNKDYVSND